MADPIWWVNKVDFDTQPPAPGQLRGGGRQEEAHEDVHAPDLSALLIKYRKEH